jgi:hypothetical protein
MTSLHGLARRLLLTITGCVSVASLGYGAQPPDVVVSDSSGNTAMGTDALLNLSGGSDNTAAGTFALAVNETGNDNSAFGFNALTSNVTGYNNTAIGRDALGGNFSGYWNTASGRFALAFNNNGAYNTATGGAALHSNEDGIENTASGVNALYSNTHGNSNTAEGVNSLESNTTGSNNTASGFEALHANTLGHDNTAMGFKALHTNTGSNNIGVGSSAGVNVTTGSNNIHMGSLGAVGDSGHIRIGTQGTQTATYIAGISGTHVTGAAVYVTSTGQLGVLASSERYKTAVTSIGSSTEKLRQLRPVSFRLKTDPKGDVQYGLIAEEVAKVYPELVIRNEAGQAEGVRYEELTPMLLNEVQQQAVQLSDMQREIVELKAALHDLQTRGVAH